MALATLTDSDVALRAALAGAEVARSRYGAHNRRFEHEGADFSTEADIEAERAIRAVLSDLRPADAVVGEELETTGDSSRRWLVDPICGTLNFAAQVPVFAVNVALDIDGVTTAAAVADPVAGHAFRTDGTGAFGRLGADLGERALAPSSTSRLVSVNLESSYEGGSGIRLLSDDVFRTRFSPRCFSSTLALAWVASGQQAAYITGGDLRGSVHWTAGIAVCRAAGAVVTNLAGGELHTGDHGLLAAADAETHSFLLDRLSALR